MLLIFCINYSIKMNYTYNICISYSNSYILYLNMIDYLIKNKNKNKWILFQFNFPFPFFYPKIY